MGHVATLDRVALAVPELFCVCHIQTKMPAGGGDLLRFRGNHFLRSIGMEEVVGVVSKWRHHDDVVHMAATTTVATTQHHHTLQNVILAFVHCQ